MRNLAQVNSITTRWHRRLLALAVTLTLGGSLLAPVAQAASVTAISEDANGMGELGPTYLHSRHAGTMPYWGPCYRCAPEVVVGACTQATTPEGGEYDAGGNDLYIESDDCNIAATAVNNTENLGDLDSSISYDSGTGDFSGAIDLSGLTEYGVICGGNSGIQGNGTEIEPLNDPTEPSGCTTPDGASGNNITLTGTVFSGGPITVENDWGFFTISPANNCLAFSFNNATIGDACLFPGTMEMNCHHYLPTSTECETTSYDDFGPPGGAYGCTNSALNSSGSCPSDLSSSSWLWGFDDGDSGTEVGGYFTFSTYYDNTSGNAIPSVISMEADSYGWLWIDDQQVMTCSQGTSCSMDYNLPEGYVQISYMVLSAPENATQTTRDPAGGIVSIVDSATGAALVSSNSSGWWINPTTPTAPNPSPQTVLDDNGDSSFTATSCTQNGSTC